MSRSEDRRLEAQLAGADIKLVLDERDRLRAQVGLLRDQLHLAEETHTLRLAELEEEQKRSRLLERNLHQLREERARQREALAESRNRSWALARDLVDEKERTAQLEAEVASLRETLRVAAEEPVEGPEPPVGQEAMEALVASLSRRRSTLWAFQLQEQNSQLRAEVAELRRELAGWPASWPGASEDALENLALLCAETKAERLTRQEAVKLVARQERELSRLRACVRAFRTALRSATEPGGDQEAVDVNRDQLLIDQAQLAQAEGALDLACLTPDRGLLAELEPTEPPECPVCGEAMTGHVCPGCGWEEAGHGK